MKYLGVLAAFCLMFSAAANATVLVSSSGILGDPNAVNEFQFTYDPVTMGGTLVIQTWGYGGTSNAPGGTNAVGLVIAGGGFDPRVTLFSGTIGGGGANLGTNDDGSCPPGTLAPSCRDSTLSFSNLAAGTYTVSTSDWLHVAGASETDPYTGVGDFLGRGSNYAIDVTTVPEPMSSMLLGSGLLALGYIVRRRRAA
jgi:hypothetical protein